jgi:hypothetical protein
MSDAGARHERRPRRAEISSVRTVRVISALVALVVAVVAIIGFFQIIPTHRVVRGRLADLVVTKPPAGFTVKPVSSGAISSTDGPFPEVKAMAKKDPNGTGAYSIEWNQTKSTNNTVTILASLLPSTSDAKTTESQATTDYLQPSSFAKEGFTYLSALSVPTPSDAKGVVVASSSSKSKARVTVVTYRVGRVVVVAFVEETDLAQVKADSLTVAAAEDAHLRQLGSGATLIVTHWPTVSSVVYIVVAVAVLGAIVGGPIVVARGRRMRQEAHERVLKRSVQARGSKVARRQAARKR